MPRVKCEICGITTNRVNNKKRSFMARFPTDENRCRQWVKVTGKEDLAYVPIEKLHQLKHICEKHFRPNDFKKKKTRLRRNAVPSIGITAEPLTDEVLKEFPLHIAKNAVKVQDLLLVSKFSEAQCSNIDLSTHIANEHSYCNSNINRTKAGTSSSSLVPLQSQNMTEPGPNHGKKPLEDLSPSVQVTEGHSQISIDRISPSTSIQQVDDVNLGMASPLREGNEEVPSLTQEALFSWEQDSAVVDDGADQQQVDDVNIEIEEYEVPSPTQEALFSWEQDSAVVPCDDGAERSVSPAVSVCSAPSPAEDHGPNFKEDSPLDHTDYRCNFCSTTITGFRYTCVQCLDMDLCGACEARQAHATHYVLRIPGPRPLAEVAARLRTVRRALLADAIVHVAPNDQSATEIKEELEDTDPIEVDAEPDGGEGGAPTAEPKGGDHRDPPTVLTVPTPPPAPTVPTPPTLSAPPVASHRGRPPVHSGESRRILVPLIQRIQIKPKQTRVLENVDANSSFYINLRNQSIEPEFQSTQRITNIERIQTNTIIKPTEHSPIRVKSRLKQASESVRKKRIRIA